MAEPETPELARAAVDGGADVVEFGFPFSDPLADGPVIRRAAERARRLADVPLYAGFGISTPAHAGAVAALADGIVVGSRAVEVAEEGPEALSDYVASLRAALDGA